MLLVSSILMLIGGIVNAAGTVIGFAMGELFAANKDVEGSDTLASLFIIYSVIILVLAVLQIIASIFGIVNRAKPAKAQACLIMGIILVLIAVFTMILSVYLNSFDVIQIFSLVFPLLYVSGALLNRPKHL